MNGGLSSTTADAPNVGGMRGPIVAAISDCPYTAVMASMRTLIVVVAAALVPVAALGGGQPVRVPRDSALVVRSEEHTSELQSQSNLVCRLLLEKKKKKICTQHSVPLE